MFAKRVATTLGLPLSVWVLWASIATSFAADNPAASYVELSGAMTGLQAPYGQGDVSGSLYNSHETKMIHVTEITVTSSGGRRVFRVNYFAAPQTVIEGVRVSTGLRLSFQPGGKDWWTWRVTKASWIDPKAWLLWQGTEATASHVTREGCLSNLEEKLSEWSAESRKATVDSSDASSGVGRVRVPQPSGGSYTIEFVCAQGQRRK